MATLSTNLSMIDRGRAFMYTVLSAVMFALTVSPASARSLLISNKGIMPVILAAALLVIGSVIVVIVLAISGQIQEQFPCDADDAGCRNARNLLNVVPIIAGAILILTGVFLMIPQVKNK